MNRSERHRYYASREWAILKEQVRDRSGGRCERCKVADCEQTHHLTYERLGNELLEDLQGLCAPCHEYVSGRRDPDPFFDVRGVLEEPKIFNGMLLCPSCGGPNLHHIAVDVFVRPEDGADSRVSLHVPDVGRPFKAMPPDNPSARRSGIRVAFICEWCRMPDTDDYRVFFLELAQHKGDTLIRWADPRLGVKDAAGGADEGA